MCIDTDKANWLPGQRNLKVLPLHQLETESVTLVHWPKGGRFNRHVHIGGEEIFVIIGEFIDEHERYSTAHGYAAHTS